MELPPRTVLEQPPAVPCLVVGWTRLLIASHFLVLGFSFEEVGFYLFIFFKTRGGYETVFKKKIKKSKVDFFLCPLAF